MRSKKALFMSIFLAVILFPLQSQAVEDKSMGLYINLTEIDKGPAGHAMHFAGKMMKRGHPVTLFLNKGAVLFASKSAPHGKFPMAGKTVPEMMQGLIKNGAVVIVCKMCAKMHGIEASDLIDGTKLGNPDLVSEFLFDPKYKAISW
ncbi:MAG: DsrE/DsrF-like family protein [endosymbiont of Escarpia spicata]|uniref:DsrE/DsrF-like family protein n=1 Tax=endosymbiont of Escarpia spicata TaxID=2200908 RepID=A0A370DKU9_9GAMM|nr:MAG: DsrE/DsrF-like family protein [endosymbiont of Escarpia spicata]